MNKRGQILDILSFLIIMMVMSIFFLAMYIAWNETNDALQQATVIPQDTKDFFDEQTNNYSSGADFIFLTIFGGVVIGVLIISYVLRSTPLLFWPVWIVVMIIGIAGGYWANTYEGIISEGVLNVASQVFPIMNYLMIHYLGVVIVVGLLMVLVYFARPGGGGGSVTL